MFLEGWFAGVVGGEVKGRDEDGGVILQSLPKPVDGAAAAEIGREGLGEDALSSVWGTVSSGGGTGLGSPHSDVLQALSNQVLRTERQRQMGLRGMCRGREQ